MKDHLDPYVSIDLLDRYLAGCATDAECATVVSWIAADPRRKLDGVVVTEPSSEAHAALARIFSADASTRSSQANERTTHATHAPMHTQAHARRVLGRSVLPHRRWVAGWRGASAIGALMVALVAVATGFWNTRHGAPRAGEADQWKSFSAIRGQRAVVQLGDGTKIVLAAESQLQVRQGRNAREVQLTGEAFFDVAHMNERPFVIHTAQGTVSELGTTFVVRSYPTDTATQVMVRSGRVSLAPKERAESPNSDPKPEVAPSPVLILNAGDVGRLRADGATTLAHGVDPQEYTAWLDGELHFVNTPLQTVADAVERWYDVKIAVANPKYAAYPFTGTLRSGSVDDVMDVISKSLGLGFEWRGNTAWIVGRKNSRTRGK